jgi:hypothetical protein
MDGVSCLSFYGAYQYVRAVVVRAGRDDGTRILVSTCSFRIGSRDNEARVLPQSFHSSAEHYTCRKLDGRYTYRKLETSNSIFLFRLHAGVANGSVKNYLANVSFSGEAGYEALSYCWRDLGSHYRNVVDRGTPLIPVSLAAALI